VALAHAGGILETNGNRSTRRNLVAKAEMAATVVVAEADVGGDPSLHWQAPVITIRSTAGNEETELKQK